MSRLLFSSFAVVFASALWSGCPAPLHHITGEGEGEHGGGEGEGSAAGEGEGEGEGHAGEGEGSVGEGEGGLPCSFDCFQAGCENAPECQENCGNFQDDNNDFAFDCKDDPKCVGTAACNAGAGVPGDPCTQPSDCASPTSPPSPECFHADPVAGVPYTGGSCGSFCTTTADCASPGICVQVPDPSFPPFPGFSFNIGVCMRGCSADSDCRDNTQVCGVPVGAPAGTPKFCLPAPGCGNGIVEVGEGCDDGNTTDGDGCSSSCQIEACNDTSAIPVAQLGDNAGDTTQGATHVFQGSCFSDASNASTTAENVWQFVPDGAGVLFAKVSSATDGFAIYAEAQCGVSSSELGCAAPDFNSTSTAPPQIRAQVVDSSPVFFVVDTIPGDEGPYTLSVAYRPSVCGDGVLEGGEVCDGNDFGTVTCASNTPNTFGPLACAADCGSIDFSACVPPTTVTETEPNDTPATANAYADPFFAQFGSDTDVDCVSVPVLAGDVVTAFFDDTDGTSCTGDFLSALQGTLTIRDGANETLDSQLTCRTDAHAVAVADDTFSVCVANSFTATGLTYRIVVDVAQPICGNGVAEGSEACDGVDVPAAFCTRSDPTTFGPASSCFDDCTLDTSNCQPIPSFSESEPNDASSPNGYSAPFIGTIDPVGDVDCVAIDANATDTIVAQVVDAQAGDGACAAGAIDSVLDFLDPNGVLITSADDGGDGKCSAGFATAETTGTYQVCVRAKGGERFGYQLNVTVEPAGCDTASGQFAECPQGAAGCTADCRVQECAQPQAAADGDNAGNVSTAGTQLLASDPNGPCQGQDTGAEQVWLYTATADGTLSATVTPQNQADITTFLVYARGECVAPSDFACAPAAFSGGPAAISLPVHANQNVYLVVDTQFTPMSGAYTLHVSLQ